MSISGTEIINCRLCGSSSLIDIIDFGFIPLGNDLNFSMDDALNAVKYPLIVKNCVSCGHHQLSYSVDKKILYQKNYSYLSSIGKFFVDHLNWSANDILTLASKKNDNLKDMFVVDIGSNDGTALSFFKEEGCKVLGVDPSNLPVQEAIKNNINTINDFFDLSLAKEIVKTKQNADIIISHNVLAHVENLKDIFQGIFYLLKENGIFVFEIGYFAHMIKDGIYDTIYHEHLDYHTLKPMLKFLNVIGFSVFDTKIVDSQGGSLRIYCKKSKLVQNNDNTIKNLLVLENQLLSNSAIIKWKNDIFNIGKKINLTISQIINSGGKIYGYGAPTKASLSAVVMGIEKDNVVKILEDNKIKVGRYLPTIGIPIESDLNVSLSNKDLIICFAWNFIDSILEKIRNKYGKGINVISTKNGKIYKT
jgi:2-polyprenyl-3-methyl-5-hydroxy-6-metoxy-1,4-benzoquinol methylase